MALLTPGVPNDPEIPFINDIIFSEALDHMIHIYPDPSNGFVNISIENYEPFKNSYTLDIIDISGKNNFV